MSEAGLRQRAGAWVVDGFFRGAARASRLVPIADPARHGVEVLRDIAYAGDGLPEHRLDIYRPTNRPGPWPVALYLHGGGFRILSKESHWIFGLILARRGYLTINANYRLAPEHRWSAAHEDAAAALLWTAREAGRYGGDASRLLLAGESAGANLATSLAVACAYQRPEPWSRALFDANLRPSAVLAACGILQVSDTARFRGRTSWFNMDRLEEVEHAYLGPGYAVPPTGPELCDPLLVLERGTHPERPLAPFFAPCGGADPLVEDSQRLQRALGKLGVACEAPIFPHQPHAFHAFVFTAAARRCWAQAFDFLRPYAGAGDVLAGEPAVAT